MNSIFEQLNGFSGVWWDIVLQSSWQSAAVCGILLLIVWLGRSRWSAGFFHALLLIALLKFAMPPMVGFDFGLMNQVNKHTLSAPVVQNPIIRMPIEDKSPVDPNRFTIDDLVNRSQETSNAIHENMNQPKSAASPNAKVQQQNPAITMDTILGTVQTPADSAPQTIRPNLFTILMLIHSIGFLVFWMWIAFSLLRLRDILRRAKPVTDVHLPQRFQMLKHAMNIKRRVRLLVSSRPISPLVYGFVHPAIIVPKQMIDRFDADEIDSVLVHELAHIRRHDAWVNSIQILLTSVWWFHPMLWLLNRELCKTREDCCDDWVLEKRISSGERYCDVLLRASTTLQPQHALSTLGFAEPLHPIARRFRRIMQTTIPRTTKISFAALLILCFTSVFLLPGLNSNTGKLAEAQTSEDDAESSEGVTIKGIVVSKDGYPRWDTYIYPTETLERNIWEIGSTDNENDPDFTIKKYNPKYKTWAAVCNTTHQMALFEMPPNPGQEKLTVVLAYEQLKLVGRVLDREEKPAGGAVVELQLTKPDNSEYLFRKISDTLGFYEIDVPVDDGFNMRVRIGTPEGKAISPWLIDKPLQRSHRVMTLPDLKLTKEMALF